MPKGSNQKLKLSYLCKIMQENTEDVVADYKKTLRDILEEY